MTSPVNRRTKDMILPIGWKRVAVGQYSAPHGINVCQKSFGTWAISHNNRVIGNVNSFDEAVLVVDFSIK